MLISVSQRSCHSSLKKNPKLLSDDNFLELIKYIDFETFKETDVFYGCLNE